MPILSREVWEEEESELCGPEEPELQATARLEARVSLPPHFCFFKDCLLSSVSVQRPSCEPRNAAKVSQLIGTSRPRESVSRGALAHRQLCRRWVSCYLL